MQRWYFLEDPSNAAQRLGRGDSATSSITSSKSTIHPTRDWLFQVEAPDLQPGEVICLVGNVKELGSWLPEKCVALQKAPNNNDSNIWSRQLQLPELQIDFRYCVCVIIENGIQAIVRSWETNLKPRSIGSHEACSNQLDFYGRYDGGESVERGWLNKETVVLLKLHKNPLTLWRAKYANRQVFIKVTPVSLAKLSEALEDSLSTDAVEHPKHAFTEVASLHSEDARFRPQQQFGHELKEGDMLFFQTTLLFPVKVSFLVDLYIYSSRAVEGEPPYHAGFSYLLPSALQQSEGSVVLPVTSTKQRPLGQLQMDYLLIGPLANFKCDMRVSYARHWKKSRASLDVGHRGSGSSFKNQPKNCAEVRENTIASLNTAIEHGADYVEFDVQLSKDLVPIIYHDFHVAISLKKKKELEDGDMLELPLKDLTLDQLKLLKIYHVTEGKSKNPRFFDEDLEDHQPFPTLQQVLEVLNPHVGFNIEIKWTMQMEDGTYELYHPTDLNLYLDTILEVVMRYGGNRRIVFSCFNPDVCQVIRMKQNKYPVLFLTVGESKMYDRYKDPRCWSIKSATKFANMVDILGINVHTEDLLAEPTLAQMAIRAGLVIFCWGDQNADPATIRYLKDLGLHGVIYDKMYQHSTKEVKESVFLMEARESQKDLLRMAAAKNEDAPIKPKGQQVIKELAQNVEFIRNNLGDHLSTATSLASLESRYSK